MELMSLRERCGGFQRSRAPHHEISPKSIYAHGGPEPQPSKNRTVCRLDVGDTAGLETCATSRGFIGRIAGVSDVLLG